MKFRLAESIVNEPRPRNLSDYNGILKRYPEETADWPRGNPWNPSDSRSIAAIDSKIKEVWGE